jgi:hypothetical protein
MMRPVKYKLKIYFSNNQQGEKMKINLSPENVANGLCNKVVGVQMNAADVDSINAFAYKHGLSKAFVCRELMRLGVEAFNLKYGEGAE